MGMFKKISLRLRLSLAFLLLAGFVGATGAFQIQTLNSLNALFGDVLQVDIPRLEKLYTLNTDLAEVEEELLRHQLETNTRSSEGVEDVEALGSKMLAHMDEYKTLLREEDEAQLDVVAVKIEINELIKKAAAAITSAHLNRD